MTKRPGSKASWEQRAAEVLAGRHRVSASELAALVREVNPTDRGLDPGQRQGRYALKSQLQSWLLRHFEDEVRVEPAPELGEGMVLLRLGLAGVSAGHVPLQELDEDARSLARRALDTAPERTEALPEEGRARGRVAPAPRAPLPWMEQGQKALDAYDFEEARGCFESALGEGQPAAVTALLSLLVDTLGLDGDAMAVAGRLESKTRASAAVRRLLGTAAARLGHLDLAVDELTGLTDRDSAPALALLARAWLAADRADLATTWLEAARQADPTEPTLLELSDSLRQRRGAAREREEQAITNRLESGQMDEATEAARELLLRFPDSSLARRLVLDEERRRRRHSLAALADEIDRLEHEGELTAAVERARQSMVLAEPSELPGWQERIRRLTTAAQEKLAQDEADRVLSLRHGEPRTFLLALAALSDDARRRVRAALPGEPPVAWLLALLQASSRRDQAVDAVLALSRAHELVESDLDGCLALLERHSAPLMVIPEAAALLRHAHERRKRRQQEAALATLARAEAALALGRSAEVLTLTESLPPSALSPVDAARATALRNQARAVQRLETLVSSLEEHLARQDTLGALRVVERLGEEAPSDPRWPAERRRLRGRLQASWRWHSHASDGASEVQLPLPFTRGSTPRPLLTPDGQRLVLATAYGRWLFVRLLSTATHRVERRVWLQTPVALEDVTVLVVEHQMVLLGGSGQVLRLGLPEGEVLDAWDSAPLRRPGERVGQIRCAHDARFLWLTLERRGSREERGVVVDLFRRSMVREFKKARSLEALPGEPARMAQFALGRTVSLHDARGVQLSSRPWSVDGQPLALLPAPGGGFVVLANRELSDAESTFEVMLLSPDGAPRLTTRVPDLDSDRLSQLAVVDDRVVLRAMGLDEDDPFVMVELDAATLREQRRQETLHEGCLVSDAAGQHLALWYRSGSTFCTLPLGPSVEMPAATPRLLYHHRLLPSLLGLSAGYQETLALERELLSWSGSRLEGWIEATRRQRKDAAASLGQMVHALEWAGHHERSRELLEQAVALHPGDPFLELRLALERLRQHRHGEALEHARRIDLARLPASEEGTLTANQCREQTALIEAVVALETGDGPAAHRAFLTAAELHQRLYPVLPGWVRATAPDAALRPGEPVERDDWLLVLLDTIRQADEALAKGDPRRATALLDSRWTFVSGEAQLLARHWRAWSEADPSGPDDEFFATEAAAAFVEAMSTTETLVGAPLPGRTWPHEQLEKLRGQAQAWLQRPVVSTDEVTMVDPEPWTG